MDNRTIDQLVVEKIMGFEVRNGQRVEDGKRFGIPSYSQKIEDAWQVVKELRENYFEISITIGEDIINVEVSTTMDDPKKVYYAYQQESLPLAICKAALKTVGVEV
ncbi:BC1872 family protein [Virgibacillus salarius]